MPPGETEHHMTKMRSEFMPSKHRIEPLPHHGRHKIDELVNIIWHDYLDAFDSVFRSRGLEYDHEVDQETRLRASYGDRVQVRKYTEI